MTHALHFVTHMRLVHLQQIQSIFLKKSLVTRDFEKNVTYIQNMSHLLYELLQFYDRKNNPSLHFHDLGWDGLLFYLQCKIKYALAHS